MGFSNRLKELRTEEGFTQRELAMQLGLTPNSICEWEKGRCEPGIEQLKKLSALFECSIDYLTENSDDFGIISIKKENPVPALSPDEMDLIKDYRALEPALQEMLRATIQTWKQAKANKKSFKKDA